MATIYYANVVTGSGLGSSPPSAYDTFANSRAATDTAAGASITVGFQFATSGLATPHALVINDTIQLVKIPKSAVIYDYYIDMPDLDSATGLTWDLGLTTQGVSLIWLASILGQAAGFQQNAFTNQASTTVSAQSTFVKGSLPLVCTCASGAALTNGYDVLQLLALTASTGAGAGGTISGWVRYTMMGGQL